MSFPEIKIIKLPLKWAQDGPIFKQESYFDSSLSPMCVCVCVFFIPSLNSSVFWNWQSFLCFHRFCLLSSSNFFFLVSLFSHVQSLSITFVSSLQNPTPFPTAIHIFKHKPAYWFQTKCVHSNISINWVGEALTLITATTLCFRHVSGIMDYY